MVLATGKRVRTICLDCGKQITAAGSRNHYRTAHKTIAYPSRHYARIRFNSYVKVDAETGCHLWIGSRNTAEYDYGCFGFDGKSYLSHRWIYEDKYGQLSDNLTLDHLCRTPCCVNVDHLEPVSSVENLRRGKAAITHCPSGHPYSGDNLKIRIRNGNPTRVCRTCTSRQWRNAKKRSMQTDGNL